jgi:hypothetical protein
VLRVAKVHALTCILSPFQHFFGMQGVPMKWMMHFEVHLVQLSGDFISSVIVWLIYILIRIDE